LCTQSGWSASGPFFEDLKVFWAFSSKAIIAYPKEEEEMSEEEVDEAEMIEEQGGEEHEEAGEDADMNIAEIAEREFNSKIVEKRESQSLEAY